MMDSRTDSSSSSQSSFTSSYPSWDNSQLSYLHAQQQQMQNQVDQLAAQFAGHHYDDVSPPIYPGESYGSYHTEPPLYYPPPTMMNLLRRKGIPVKVLTQARKDSGEKFRVPRVPMARHAPGAQTEGDHTKETLNLEEGEPLRSDLDLVLLAVGGTPLPKITNPTTLRGLSSPQKI